MEKFISKIERLLDVYIAVYDRTSFDISKPISKHFCLNVKGADLNNKQLKILKRFEEKFIRQNLSLVAYEKPFKIYPQEKLIRKYLSLK